MTEKKRIMLNIVATYGRSVYSLVIGLICGRWTLLALGQTDYGLVGLIGGLTGFVTFFNGLLAQAIGRFYAVSVGAAKKAGNEKEGLEECRKWFNTALSLHVAIPLIMLAIGYPMGVWAIEKFLTIPLDRINECIWIWRFTCCACIIGLFNVPFNAMYGAKQEIAELTVYSFITTTLNALFGYYMITHPGIWMVKYSLWMCVIGTAPNLIIAVRAVQKYPECRLRFQYLWSIDRYKQLFVFAFARFWSEFSGMVTTQTNAILTNKYMGPKYNAAMSVGNTVACHSLTLSGAMTGAFMPAIFNKAGEGDRDAVKKLCFMTFRIGTVLVLIFALPLMLEIKEVLHLWLVTPPDFAAEICAFILIREILDRMSVAFGYAILAYGKGVVRYSWTIGWAGLSSVVLAWVLFVCGCGMWSICIGIVYAKIFDLVVRLFYGKRYAGFGAAEWFKSVFMPITFLIAVTLAIGVVPRFFMASGFVRIVVTTIICESVLLALVWKVVLNIAERQFVTEKILPRIPIIKNFIKH